MLIFAGKQIDRDDALGMVLSGVDVRVKGPKFRLDIVRAVDGDLERWTDAGAWAPVGADDVLVTTHVYREQ